MFYDTNMCTLSSGDVIVVFPSYVFANDLVSCCLGNFINAGGNFLKIFVLFPFTSSDTFACILGNRNCCFRCWSKFPSFRVFSLIFNCRFAPTYYYVPEWTRTFSYLFKVIVGNSSFDLLLGMFHFIIIYTRQVSKWGDLIWIQKHRIEFQVDILLFPVDFNKIYFIQVILTAFIHFAIWLGLFLHSC